MQCVLISPGRFFRFFEFRSAVVGRRPHFIVPKPDPCPTAVTIDEFDADIFENGGAWLKDESNRPIDNTADLQLEFTIIKCNRLLLFYYCMYLF